MMFKYMIGYSFSGLKQNQFKSLERLIQNEGKLLIRGAILNEISGFGK